MLAQRLGCPFYEGDDYHPAANIEKMRVRVRVSGAVLELLAGRRCWQEALSGSTSLLLLTPLLRTRSPGGHASAR